MISFYSGLPGSGKSYHFAQLCYEYLRYNDVNLITNFDINLDLLSLSRLGWIKYRLTEISDGKIKFKVYNKCKLKGRYYRWQTSQITVSNLLQFADQHHMRRRHVDVAQTIVMIDESGILFNCREFSSKDRMQWLDFFSKHRHFNFDFLLGCQWDRQVDKQIRCCVEYDFVHRKLRNYQFLGWLISVLSGGNLFLVAQNWYANKLHVRNSILRYSPRIACLYDTLHDFGSDPVAAADAPPPGVGGDRGPTAPAPDAPPAAPASTEDLPAGHMEQLPAADETLDQKFSRWKAIMKNE